MCGTEKEIPTTKSTLLLCLLLLLLLLSHIVPHKHTFSLHADLLFVFILLKRNFLHGARIGTVLNWHRCRRRQLSHYIFESHFVESIRSKKKSWFFLLVFVVVVDTYSRCVFSKLIHSGLCWIVFFCSHISISMHLNSVSKCTQPKKKEIVCANKWNIKLQLNELLGKFVIFPIFIIGFTVFFSLCFSERLFSLQVFIMVWIGEKYE